MVYGIQYTVYCILYIAYGRTLSLRVDAPFFSRKVPLPTVQGYLAHKKERRPRNLQ